MKSYKEDVEQTFEEWVGTIMGACGKIAEGETKKLCPVDTGRLRNSITYDVAEDGKSVRIGTNVKYAKYVEFDDRKKHVVGQAHFLRDGITRSIPQCNNLITSMGVGESIKVD